MNNNVIQNPEEVDTINFFKQILKWIKQLLKPKPPKPEPEPEFDITKIIIAGGEDFRNAKETVKITGSGNKNGTTLTYPQTNWETHDGNCNGFVGVIYRLPDGSIKGGKFDWLPQNEASYHWGFKHIYDGYKGHVAPSVGADAWSFIFSIDNRERSDFVKFIWK